MTGSFLIRNKNADTVFVLFSIAVTINCFGRYMLATSQSLEMAIWANKFLYVGGLLHTSSDGIGAGTAV